MDTNSFIHAIGFFIIIAVELTALFLGISFAVALALEYVPDEKLRKLLSRGGPVGGGVAGTVLGGLTPFCSCSTIPVMLGFLKAKAPFGAVMSFLIASPLLNPIVLGLFWAILGWRATLVYAVSAFLFALVGGWVWERLGLANHVRQIGVSDRKKDSQRGSGSFKSKALRSWSSAWGDFRGVATYMFIGVAIGAGIYGFVPEDFVVRIAGPQNPLAVPVAAIVGVPLYVRAETIIPIGAALLQKGMGAGAVIALAIGGAGASIPEVSMLSSIFKPRLVGAFVITILGAASFAGLSYNFVF